MLSAVLESLAVSLFEVVWIDTRTTSIASVLMTLGMVLGLGGLIRAESQYRTCRRLRSDSLTDLRRLPEDEPPHEVHGVVEPHEGTLTAPFTGTECVAYLYDVVADPDGEPERIDFDGEPGPFRVRTESGTALVDLEEVDFEVETGDVYDIGPHGSVPSSIWRRIQSMESSRPDLPDETPDGGMQLVEVRVESGSEVYAIGEAERIEDADGSADADVRLTDGDATDGRISDASGSELAAQYRRSAIRSLLAGGFLFGCVAAVYLL